ncbi:hybrid sensor histidine kinase/response regulator [Dulcicalothrix desertica PCC 7102]|uniref:histidine kinase n=1 Tax=Dulcicalothrix desertica PCC 7102 TaxID=232991 RepID=A0A433VKN6_9CYAN|nr:hybrid sensor histidine kinase/response regulator [Dulcicalothrix desertica]RUT06641.1 hybrid sensor histidine kinase/response regulator [Dulcicalothrix desertica PCC 7102]TWH50247.1 chemotaxis protein histidine kinase CheA [Dulcicalothrix desertica PCC 7102]
MNDYQEQLIHHFSLEAPELLATIEQALQSLQVGKNNIEQVRTLMRATHTLKSIAATLGLETIKNISHSLEDVFRAIQAPDVKIDTQMQALFFESYECLRDPLMAELNGLPFSDNKVVKRFADVFSKFRAKLGEKLVEETHAIEQADASNVDFDSIKTLFESYIGPELEKTATILAGAKPKEASDVLRQTTELFQSYAKAIQLQSLEAIAETTITALDNNPRSTRRIARLAIEDFRSYYNAIVSGENPQTGYPSSALLALAKVDNLPQLDSLPEVINLAPKNKAVSDVQRNQPVECSVECTLMLEEVNNAPAALFPKVVRVNVDHLEQLNYLNAELLTNQNRQFLQDTKTRNSLRKLLSRLRQFQQMLGDLQDWSNPLMIHYTEHNNYKNQGDNFDYLELDSYNELQIFIQNLIEEAGELEQEIDLLELVNRQTTQLLKKQQKLLTNSRDVLLEARMLPLGSILNRLYPVLEQLQNKYNKSINLNIKGNEVLVDKAIAERLYEPLLHLVRNSFDHGIETSEIRSLRGKLPVGQIEIRAYYQGSQLIIDVQDDGEGLDFNAIRKKAVAKGLITEDIARIQTDSQLAELLFEPEFSTAKQVNDVSGRGVGLDVVKVQLQAIQGSVAVHTEAHKNTTFSLQIPLSLSISKLLVCQVGKKVYALAADTIDQILLPKPGQIQESEHGRILRLPNSSTNKRTPEGELVRIYRLAEILDYSSRQPAHITSDAHAFEGNTLLPLLIVRCQEQLLALEVDRIIWEQELVIRPFGKLVPTPPYVYGGTILADGGLTLVINGAALLDHILNQEIQIMEQSWEETRTSPQKNLPTHGRLHRVLPTKSDNHIKTVVIVDDSITLRQALVFTLQKAGYQTLQARDGYEAISHIKTHPEIHLIICDIEMPRMNGFEFLAHCAAEEHLSNIPILILSSRTATKHRHLALKLGARAYLTKPYSEAQLLSAVTQVFNSHKLLRNPVSM